MGWRNSDRGTTGLALRRVDPAAIKSRKKGARHSLVSTSHTNPAKAPGQFYRNQLPRASDALRNEHRRLCRGRACDRHLISHIQRPTV
jgi:hypothetical protein